MAIGEELFLAILSMDAYNRGYRMGAITARCGEASSDETGFGAAAHAAAQRTSHAQQVITVDANTTITLQNVALANLHQNDFVFV